MADSGADMLDHAGAFVAQNDGHFRPAHRAVHDVQTAVAHTVGSQPHEHLAGVRLRQVDRFDHQWLVRLVQHRRPHASDRS
jgi:hypothetical protein